MIKRTGETQKKILLLLFGGIALGLSGSPKKYFQILNSISKEWKEIDRQKLRRSIMSLYKSKLVSIKENKDGTMTLILTKDGKEKALTYELDKISITVPKRWDGKWRMVVFDIPEHLRRVRDALRGHLQNLKFYELQKSVFIHPYDCQDEIEYLIEFHSVRKFVRFIIAESLDNELHLKKYFKLSD